MPKSGIFMKRNKVIMRYERLEMGDEYTALVETQSLSFSTFDELIS